MDKPKRRYGYVTLPFDNSPFSGGKRVKFVKEEGYTHLTRKDRICAGDEILKLDQKDNHIGWFTISKSDKMIGERWCSALLPMRRKVKPIIDIRTITMYWTCGVCNKQFNPQMVVAVFEKFTNAVTNKEDLRVKHFQCLHHTENR